MASATPDLCLPTQPLLVVLIAPTHEGMGQAEFTSVASNTPGRSPIPALTGLDVEQRATAIRLSAAFSRHQLKSCRCRRVYGLIT